MQMGISGHDELALYHFHGPIAGARVSLKTSIRIAIKITIKITIKIKN